MEESSFIFTLNNIDYPIPSDFNLLSKFPKKISQALVFKDRKYNIESNVSEKVFKSFIDYLVQEKIPNIDVDNYFEYFQLSEEFNMMKEIIKTKEEEFGCDLKYYQGLHLSNLEDRIFYENKISEELDYYLQKYQNNIMSQPIDILYNIFFNPKRKLKEHNYAYEIMKMRYEETGDTNIFILLPSLDGTKLSKENFQETIRKRKERFGFLPTFDISYLTDEIEKVEKYEIILEEQKSKIKYIEDLISNIQKQHSNELENIQKQYSTDISNIQKHHSNDIENIHKQHSNEFKNLQKQHSTDISNIQKQHSQEINELKMIIENQNKEILKIQTNQKESEQKINRINDEMKNLQEILSKQTIEINSIKTKQKEENSALTQIFENKTKEITLKLKEREDTIKQEIHNLQETLSKQTTEINLIKMNHKKSNKTLKQTFENRINEIVMKSKEKENEIQLLNKEQTKGIELFKIELDKSKTFLLTKICENSNKSISFVPSLTENGILYKLRTESKNIFDPPFIISQSSNDIYNLINSDSNDRFSTTNYGNFFFKFELENPIMINGIKIFSSKIDFPKSFDIEIDDEIIQSIKEAKELNGANKEMTINFPSKKAKVIRFIQTGPNWDDNTNFLHFKRFELISPQSKYSAGVFATLIKESKYHDPHNCGVLISSPYFDHNSIHLIDSKQNIWTFNDENPWLQIELTKGFAILTGFRIKECHNDKIKSFKVIASDDINKPISTWQELAEINEKNENEHEFTYIYKFTNPSTPIRFIRIIQTGPNWSDQKYLVFYHFELFGTYF